MNLFFLFLQTTVMKKLSRKFPIFSNLPECSKLSRKGNGFFLEVEADDAYVREEDWRLICLQVPVDLVLVCNEKLLFGFYLVPCFLEFPGSWMLLIFIN